MANGDNNQVKVVRTLGLIVTVVVIILSWGIALGRYGDKIEQNGHTAEQACDKAEQAQEKANINERAIIGLQKDMEYIKKGVDEIKADIKQVLKK